ncbi:PH domain-containing protein [Blastococcus sp. TF02A-35]|uniref:PH domain-containing protein n=1 Tax=Blastococcus sp. TF02A-35 TaxID=2559612 RepID=UPI0010748167|nr:PH domain-containing protein [Blastococcus sp. TF02A_35]TFV44824.1 PH domain-containing protein [Blastococcus sp. TF02A_35]
MRWSPPVVLPVVLAAGGLLLGALAATLEEAPGRVLIGAAALLLVLLAVREAVLRPRLAATDDGLEVATLGGRRLLPWAAVRVRVRTARRWGTTVRTLELDTATGPDDEGLLVVLGRWDLGADPVDVAWALERRTDGR